MPMRPTPIPGQGRTHTLKRVLSAGSDGQAAEYRHACINCSATASDALELLWEACPDVSNEPAAILADVEATLR